MRMKVSFITTVYNEEKTVLKLLDSLFKQSKLPAEVIIVDGGSTDATASVISNLKSQISNEKIKLKFVVKKGNRSVGRNEAIRNATGDIIVCSDAGCILDKDWIKNIIKPFRDPNIDVVAGYYKGDANSIFQKCLIPYALAMPDKIDEQNFLPASRSMAFKKSILNKVGGFPEEFSHNEDYVFAQKLKNAGAKIVFNKDAIVYWKPRKNIKEAFIMFFRFALGDAEAGIFRSKVLLVFARYLLGIYLLLLSFIMRSSPLFYVIVFGFLVYILWSIWKNYRYASGNKALFFLPILQFISDLAVLLGTTFGFLKKISFKKIAQVIINNKGVSLVIVAYTMLMVLLVNWGIPNKDHPFNYHMDEWHQAQAVRTVFELGTPNVAGSANGSMFHFFLTGLYLIPFVVLGIVNPFTIESPILSLDIQHRLFQILRLNTLLFGIGSIILIVYIGKKYFKLHPFLISFLFVVNPIWLTLSNYFKYDIALTFWLLLSIKFLLSYSEVPTLKKYCYAGIVCSLALSTKISALPVIPIYILTYIIYSQNVKKKLYHLIFGLLLFLFIFILFGIPDLILGKGNITEYLRSNLIETPKETSNIILGIHYLIFLITKNYPASFGHVLFYILILAFILNFLGWIKKLLFHLNNLPFLKFTLEKKNYIFLYLSFLFFSLSLIPLKFDARGNRLLVILPFIVIIAGIFLTKFLRFLRRFIAGRVIFFTLLFFGFLIQAFETFGWVSVKLNTDPRNASSTWIERNISKGRLIGIENIPIYQSLPDIVLKEYYNKQYNGNINTRYNYMVIGYQSRVLPDIIIVINDEIVAKYLKTSPKKLLTKRLEKEKYKKIAQFQPDYSYFKFFGNDLIFFYSQLSASPNTVSVFSRDYNL